MGDCENNVKYLFCSCFRTLKSFESYLRKGGKGCDYITYSEICTMMNVIIDLKNKVCLLTRCIYYSLRQVAYRLY